MMNYMQKICKKRRLLTMMLLGFLLASICSPALASEPEQPGITLNQAIEQALRYSDSIHKAEQEVDKQKEWRDYRNDKLDFIPRAPNTAYVEVPWAQFLTTDLQWQMSKKSLTAEQEKVAMDACSKYWNILKGQEKIKDCEVAVKAARLQLQTARAANQVGMSLVPTMSSNQALVAAEAQYTGAEAALAAAKNDLDKAYILFNQALRLAPEDRPVLKDTVVYKPLEVGSLESEVNRVLAAAPTLWQAEQMVNINELLKDLTLYAGEYKPYEARKSDVIQAEFDAASTRKLFDRNTRSLYYATKSLEEAYSGAQQRLKTCEENYRVMQAKFDVGMATNAEMAAEEKNLADARYSVFELTCRHCYMKLAFEKPWAADAAAM